MYLTIIGVGSVTNAMRGKDLLEKKGIRAYIQRKTEVENGCGYRLTVYDHGERAVALLRQAGIRVNTVQAGGDSP